ncbi:MAG TPA: hypothetical protein VG897_16820, partial [Terriglobales bacterium]|nr:hypothetical protein [Terriglobales bacterium]
MTASVSDLTSVTIAVDEALQLLDAYAGDQLGGSMGESLPSLVEQCEILLSELQSQSEEAIRSLHHFACTGGTLISRCIAAMPNTVLLSEIDPLSSQYKKLGPNKFFPTDLTHYLGNNLRPPDEDMVIGMFLAGIDSLREQLSQGGRRLVLRDHSHSQYCCVEDSRSRPSLRS